MREEVERGGARRESRSREEMGPDACERSQQRERKARIPLLKVWEGVGTEREGKRGGWEVSKDQGKWMRRCVP